MQGPARTLTLRYSTVAATPLNVSAPDAESGWFAFVHAGPPTVTNGALVRLIDTGAFVVALTPLGVDTLPNGPFHVPPIHGYWFVHPEIRFQLNDTLSNREWAIEWTRGPHRIEKGRRIADMVYWSTQLPNPGGPGGAWNDVGPNGGLPPSPSRPWLQITSPGPAGAGIDLRLVDAAAATTFAVEINSVGIVGASRGAILHAPNVRLQARSNGAVVKRMLATWSSEGGKSI